MTSNVNCTLKIYVTDWDNVTKYAMYKTFRIADEADGYCLSIGGYYGDAGDSLTRYHDGQIFSTKDRDNDNLPIYVSSAEYFSDAWWYGSTASSCLNGQYYFRPDVSDGNGIAGIMWFEYSKSFRISMKETRMLIKAN